MVYMCLGLWQGNLSWQNCQHKQAKLLHFVVARGREKKLPQIRTTLPGLTPSYLLLPTSSLTSWWWSCQIMRALTIQLSSESPTLSTAALGVKASTVGGHHIQSMTINQQTLSQWFEFIKKFLKGNWRKDFTQGSTLVWNLLCSPN